MRHAVTQHASGIEVPKLDDPNMIRLGAAHFHRGLRVLSWSARYSGESDR
jgi:hypothetical protein